LISRAGVTGHWFVTDFYRDIPVLYGCSLLIYERDVSARIGDLQITYLERSTLIELRRCQSRSLVRCCREKAAHVLAAAL
jgi:hypothetical protein